MGFSRVNLHPQHGLEPTAQLLEPHPVYFSFAFRNVFDERTIIGDGKREEFVEEPA